MSRETFEGVLTVRRTRNLRQGNSFGALLADSIAPRYYAPMGWVQYPKSDAHPQGWQVRFKRLPESLHGCDGHRIRVACTPERWSNGLGLYAARPKVECLDEAEHVLAALAALPDVRVRP